MCVAFDDHAILDAGFCEGREVASARLLVRAPNEEWEHDRFLKWPGDFPQRADCIEISRLCIDREFREIVTLAGLLRVIGLQAALIGRCHLIACSTDKLRIA
jgi:hypothetical protein